MKRALLVLAVSVITASAAFADVTVVVSVVVSAAQMSADGTMTSYAKGAKFRADTNVSGQSITVLSDAASKQQWMINHGTKEIAPFDPQKALAGMPVSFGEAKASVKPNGETKEVLGRTCQGFLVEVTMPMTIAGETIVLKMSGPAWVARDGVGVAEFKAAQKAFSDLGMSTSMLAQGPSAKALAEVNKVLGAAGVVMEQQNQMTMEGTGQMAQMMGQMGGMTMTLRVTAISTDPIPDAKFALPEGYTKK